MELREEVALARLGSQACLGHGSAGPEGGRAVSGAGRALSYFCGASRDGSCRKTG